MKNEIGCFINLFIILLLTVFIPWALVILSVYLLSLAFNFTFSIALATVIFIILLLLFILFR